MEDLTKCKYCDYTNNNSIKLSNHQLNCYKGYIQEVLSKNSKIYNFVENVKTIVLDTLIILDDDFEKTVNDILDDYVALHHKLELIKIDRFSKNGTVGTMKRLNRWIKYINNNKALTLNQLEEMRDLFFLVDRNFYELEKLKDLEQKTNIENAIQEFYPNYKLDKISIIENLKKQIQDLHIDKNQTVTVENLQTHTLNAIIFAYKDYYNVGLVPNEVEKENGFINKEIASNPFFKLVNNLKLNRSNKTKFSNDIHGNKISKKDFKYFENYLLFDSMSILDYSKLSFLGRKLYIFYEDASRQSGEFKKLQEDLQARDEAIKTKKITLSKRTNELLSNEKEFLKQMLRIRFDREKNIYYII